ncbi:MAG: FecR family protein [Cyanobacteriota bacterium]|nr:FecR family protein [Cyanobacteriota bacterium]
MKLHPARTFRLLALVLTGILLVALPLLAKDLQLPSSRFVEVRQIRGKVTYQGRQAKVGDRLTTSGQQIATGVNSSAVLAVDTAIATINVSENSILQVKNLSLAAKGGRVTVLGVPKGQARIQARTLKNPNSRLEISSPSGVAGVRGTVFGVAVDPKGKTGISTLEGAVATTAKGQTVIINGGYSSVVFPGSPPTSPRLTKDKLKYKLESLSAIGNNKIRLICIVDPLNLAFLNNRPIEINQKGKIDAILPAPANSDLRLVVRSPLGEEKYYNLGAKLRKSGVNSQ